MDKENTIKIEFWVSSVIAIVTIFVHLNQYLTKFDCLNGFIVNTLLFPIGFCHIFQTNLFGDVIF